MRRARPKPSARAEGAALLQTLMAVYKSASQPTASAPNGHLRVVREDREDFEELAAAGPALPPAAAALLRRQIDAWVLPALAAWTRNNAESFVRAAAHPDPGVTVRIRLTLCLDWTRSLTYGRREPGGQQIRVARNTHVSLSVTSGRRKK